MDQRKITRSFIDDPVTDIRELKGGHINRSFLVEAGERYVLQRVNGALFGGHIDALENNYVLYANACEQDGNINEEWLFPKWLKTKTGQYFHTDEDGEIWRMYKYIESDDNSGNLLSIGEGLGKLHSILKHCDGIINIETTRHLHDLSFYYEKFCDLHELKTPRDNDIEHIIEQMIKDLLNVHVPAGDVIHGDAKTSNMIFRKGKVAGFVDLDTIMNGSVYDDLCDLARGICVDKNGAIDTEPLADILKGYGRGAGISFKKDETELLKQNLVKNRFMLGLRYYTDYLSGAGYFAGMTQVQELERARRLML